MPDDKLPIPQFAAKIKAKYPQYKDVNDTVLVQRIVEKYPEYAESVDMSALTPKKKETGGGLSSIGARVGVPASKAQSLSGRSLSQGIESVGEVEYEPEDDKTRLRQIVGFKKNERPFDQTKEDAVKGAANRLGEIMYGEGDEWKDPIKATMNGLKSAKSTKDALDFYGAKNLTEDALMPNGFEAKRILGSTIFGQAGADNMTANALKKKANTYEKVVSPFRGINPQELTYLTKDRVYDAAIRSYANQNEHFKKQLEAAGVDLSKNDLGLSLGDSDAKRGEIMQVVLNNPDVMTFLQNEKPELIPLMKDVQENLIYDNKDFGKVQLANEISRDMQKGGYNKIDPVFNLENNAKEAGDATAELLYANDPKKLQFYRENKDAILSKLDAPSLFSSFAEAGEGFGSGILNTFTEPFTPASKTIKENWEKEARHVSSNPTGFVKFLSDSGHALGFVASIGATGNVLGASGILNPKTSGAVATAIGFLGDQLEQGRMKYPDSPIKAYTSALFNTGLYTALSFQLFPAAKVEQAFTAVKPGISNIVENLASGNITREVAKAQMNTLGKRALEIAGEGLSKNVKVSAEMTGITMLNKALDKAMGMDKDTFRQFHPEGEEADTAKSMFLSNIIVNGLAAYGQVKAKNNLAKNAIYEAASFPNRYRNIIESSEIRMKVAETKDMLDNLDYVSNLKRELDNRGLTERQKKDYIYNALQSKVLNAAKPASPEAALTRKSEDRLKDLEEINAGILEGKDADEVITTNEQKIIDENKKYEDNLSKIDKELETLTSNKELDNKEIDLKIQNLEKKDNPLYEIQKQKLEQQRKENNDYYDSSIEKLNKEKGDLLIKRGRNDEQFLKDQALDAPNALKSQLGGEKEVVEVIAKSTIPEIEEAIKKWEDRLKKDDVTEEEADRHISLLEKGIELVKEREKLAEIYQQRELDNGMTPPEGKETPTPTEENVGTVSEGVLKEISDKDAENVFNKLLEDEYGTDEYGIEGLLYDWGGVEYNKDSGELSFEDTRSGTGNLSSTKKEFIDDILNGKIEKEIPAIKEYVQKLKELILKEIGEEKPSTVTEQPTQPQPTKEEYTTQEQVTKTKAQELADKVRALKLNLGNNKLQSNVLGLPAAVWDGAMEIVAKTIEAGGTVADAIKRGLNHIQKNHRGQWDKRGFNDQVMKELGVRGITVNGQDLVVKDVDREFAETINGFYSDIEQSVLDVRKGTVTAKEWLSVIGKGDEAKWTGISQWLESMPPNQVVPRQEVLNWMKDNRIQVVEVVKSSGLQWSDEAQREFEKVGIDFTTTNDIEDAENPYFYNIKTGDEIMPEDMNKRQKAVYDKYISDKTKYSQHQLEGEKSNYKEVLVTLPMSKEKKSFEEWVKDKFGETTDGWSEGEIKAAKQQYNSDVTSENWAGKQSATATKNVFKSSHFDEPNILVHLRMNTRKDADGKKVLFLEEVQSDWGQKGKKEGFANIDKLPEGYRIDEPTKFSKWTVIEPSGVDGNLQSTAIGQGETKSEAVQRALENLNRRKTVTAPFVTETPSWTKLGLKVALKEAVRQGADKIAWTTGEQQNKRYDLSQHVDEVIYDRMENGGTLIAYKDGAMVMDEKQVAPEKLADYIGKEAAEKILKGDGLTKEEERRLNYLKEATAAREIIPSPATKAEIKRLEDKKSGVAERGELKGEQLQVGGKGMKGFYGSPSEGKLGIVGEVAKSLFKQEPKKTTIQVDSNYTSKIPREGKYSEQHSIEITPELKAEVQGGLPLFKDIKGRGKEIADLLRKGKIKMGGLQSNIAGIPIAVYNGAIEVIARALEGGATLTQAINEAYKKLKLKERKGFDQNEFIKKLEDATGEKFIEEAPPSDSTPRGQDGEPPVGDGVGKIGEGEGGGDVKPSGIRKALVSEEIVKGVDLEKVGDKEMMAMGRKIIDSGDVKPKELVEKIVSEKTGVLTPAEVVALITYKADIDNKLRDIYTEINEKQANGEDIGTLGVEAKNLEVEKRNFDIAAVITANQQSMAFRLRQWMLDPEYNATTEIEKYKKNNFGEIPDEIKKKFEDLEKQITDLRSKIREAQEKKDKQEAENAINDILEDIERERKRNGGLTEEEVQERIEKGVQEEIDAIYKKLPKDKKSIADKAIDALQKLEDKLKGKTYADPTGVVAAIRIGISTIKNAIKAGVAVADAIEIGIEKIREYVKKNGITSFDENDFRKEAIDTFEASGVSTKNKDDDKPVLNDDGTVTIPNKMIRNIVSKGVTDVDAVVNEVQKEVEKILPGVTKRQVRDYITGYGKKTNPTKDAVQQEINELKRVGKLLSELEDVQAGIRKTTDKQKRQALSQRERDLRRQIKALNKEIPFTEEELQSQEESRLSAAKTRTKSRIEELIDRLKNKNFATKKPIPVKADAELNDLLKQKEALQEEYEIEHKKNEIKNRTWWQKVEDIALEIFSGIPRAIVAGADLSAMFVQGTRHFFTRPIDSFKAFGESLRQFVSDKRQQEWLDRLKSSKAYPLIRASKLAISDKDGKLSAKEQIFIINWLNQIYDIGATILGLGQRPMVDFFKRLNPFKASQRAFDGYLNYIRVSKFLKIAKKLEYDGYNFESNPKEFTELGDWVNTVTGRARLGSMESSSKWLSIAMFAPRKVAAELKLYTPYAFLYYAKMPKKVRAEALKELAFFASSFLVTNSLLKAALGNWDDDDDFWNPDSSNFLTHKIGSTNVGFGGGAKSTLVMLSRLFGKRYTDQYGRDSKLGERFGKKINTKWDVIQVFLEGKASPGASLILKKLDEKKGLENDDMEYLKSVTMPMWMQDLGDLYRKNPEEVGAILTLLSLIGANVRVVDEPKKPSKPSRPKRERPKIDRPNR